jgi:hypothetical protein
MSERMIEDMEARLHIRLDRIEAAIRALDGKPKVNPEIHKPRLSPTAYDIAKDDH